jgi:hypothetical protein
MARTSPLVSTRTWRFLPERRFAPSKPHSEPPTRLLFMTSWLSITRAGVPLAPVRLAHRFAQLIVRSPEPTVESPLTEMVVDRLPAGGYSR